LSRKARIRITIQSNRNGLLDAHSSSNEQTEWKEERDETQLLLAVLTVSLPDFGGRNIIIDELFDYDHITSMRPSNRYKRGCIADFSSAALTDDGKEYREREGMPRHPILPFPQSNTQIVQG
jgi:hypothetical protein